MLHVIFIFIRELIFSPFKKINLKGICFGVVFAWTILLIWSLISYEKDGYVWGLGIIQLFVCLCLLFICLFVCVYLFVCLCLLFIYIYLFVLMSCCTERRTYPSSTCLYVE